jgi:hypothetical protein
MFDAEKIDLVGIIEYIRNYFKNPKQWSTPRGLLNLLIIFQVMLGSYIFHNIFWNLEDIPNWFELSIGSFLFLKYILYTAYTINVTKNDFHMGIVIGGGLAFALNSLQLCFYWNYVEQCVGHDRPSLVIRQQCHTDLLKVMLHQYWCMFFLFIAQVIFVKFCISYTDYITSETSAYMVASQVDRDYIPQTMSSVSSSNSTSKSVSSGIGNSNSNSNNNTNGNDYGLSHTFGGTSSSSTPIRSSADPDPNSNSGTGTGSKNKYAPM